MKSLINIISVFLCILSVSGQTKEYCIKGHQLIVRINNSAETEFETDSLLVFHKHSNKPILNILHKSICRDSNSESVMIGDYDVTDSTLVLYHFWAKAGDMPVDPFGARIQTYSIAKGQLVLKDSKLYIETIAEYYIYQYQERENLSYHAGAKYLHYAPKNAIEQQKLKAYVKGVEKEYNAKFVWGKEADELLATVRKRLATDLWKYTHLWRIHYKESAFGYKR